MPICLSVDLFSEQSVMSYLVNSCLWASVIPMMWYRVTVMGQGLLGQVTYAHTGSKKCSLLAWTWGQYCIWPHLIELYFIL